MNSGPPFSHGPGGWEIQDGEATLGEILCSAPSYGGWDLMARYHCKGGRGRKHQRGP